MYMAVKELKEKKTQITVATSMFRAARERTEAGPPAKRVHDVFGG